MAHSATIGAGIERVHAAPEMRKKTSGVLSLREVRS